MISSIVGTKYGVKSSSRFNRQLRKIAKQGKDVEKLKYVVNKLANGMKLEEKYNDHSLKDTKHFKNYRECHIEPDWLLIFHHQYYWHAKYDHYPNPLQYLMRHLRH